MTLTLEGGSFTNNTATGGRGGPGGQGGDAAGGGIDIDTSSTADLIGTTLSENAAIGGEGGSGGIGVGGGIAAGLLWTHDPSVQPGRLDPLAQQ